MSKAKLTVVKPPVAKGGRDLDDSCVVDEIALELGRVRALGDILAMIDYVKAFNQETFNFRAWEIVIKCDNIYKLMTGEEKERR